MATAKAGATCITEGDGGPHVVALIPKGTDGLSWAAALPRCGGNAHMGPSRRAQMPQSAFIVRPFGRKPFVQPAKMAEGINEVLERQRHTTRAHGPDVILRPADTALLSEPTRR